MREQLLAQVEHDGLTDQDIQVVLPYPDQPGHERHRHHPHDEQVEQHGIPLRQRLVNELADQ